MSVIMGGMMGVGFTPLELSPALWLDAADSSTVTLVSSAVSQWSDKSGNGRHATQSTSGDRPAYPSAILNGLPVIRFAGGGKWLSTAATAIGGTNFTIFIVTANPLASQAAYANILDYDHAGTPLSNWTIQQDNTTNNTNYFAFDTSGGTFVTTANLSTTGVNLLAFQKNGTSLITSKNGTQATMTVASTFYTTTKQIGIGRNVNFSARTWGGDIGEIVVFNSALSGTNLQKVEGYLAWKWGTQSSLPSGHPYKTSAP